MAMVKTFNISPEELERLKSLCTCKFTRGRVHEYDCPQAQAVLALSMNSSAEEKERILEVFRQSLADLSIENLQLPAGLNAEQRKIFTMDMIEKRIRLIEDLHKLGLTDADLKL